MASLEWIRGLLRCLLLACVMLGLASIGTEAKTGPEAAQGHYEAAVRHADEGALRAAVIELKNALQRDPDYADARLLLGEVYLQLGDGAAAEKELRVAARLGLPSERVAVPLGEALLLQRRFDQVLAEFAAENFDPDIALDIALLRADAHAGLGEADAARTLYDVVIQQDPEETGAYVGRARLALAARDFVDAEAQANAALARRPDDSEALLVQAEARRLDGRPEAALAPLRSLLGRKPARPDIVAGARLGLAAALLALGRDTEAEREAAAVAAMAPGHPLPVYLQALIKLRQQDVAGARRLLDGSASSLEGFVPAQFLFGIVTYASGDMETARSWLARHVNAQPDNLQARKLLAAALLRLGAVEEATRVLETARSQAPDDPQILMLLGNANLRSGNAAEGSSLLQQAAALAPEDPRVLGQLAISHMATGARDEALAALSATLELDEDAGGIGYAMAFVHLRAAAFGDALRVAQALRERYPDSALAANLEGAAYVGLGDLDRARTAFKAALAIDPSFLEARGNLAALKARTGDFAGAEKDYREILRDDGSHLASLMGMAALANHRKDSAETRQWLDRAVEENTNALRPSLALAQHHMVAGESAAAVAVLQALVQHEPRSPQALTALGRVQLQAGEGAAAVETYERLAEVSGRSIAARRLLAEAQLAAHDLDAARRSYEDLRALADGDPVVWNNLAWLYHQAGDPRALAHGERALELAPAQPSVMDTLGWILLDGGKDLERAAALLEQAHEETPDSGTIGYHYAVALHRTGRDSAARQLLQSLLREDRTFSTMAEAKELLQVLGP